jgi:heme-degrading monooxygenase HmoA
MYGTVARFRVKPGMEQKLQETMSGDENIPGYVGAIVYKMDDNPNEMYLAVVFDSKEAYVKNADSPEQDARYREFREMLEADPEWHDGEVVYSKMK